MVVAFKKGQQVAGNWGEREISLKYVSCLWNHVMFIHAEKICGKNSM